MREMLFFGILTISYALFASESEVIVNQFLNQQISKSSSAKVSCICQMGQEPLIQKWFFKKGCEIWLDEQTGCDEKRILNEAMYSKPGYGGIELDPIFKNGLVKLGFVGHWGAGIESYHYFKNVIVPTIEKHNVSIFWDNSGCSGLNAPESVLGLIYMQSDLNFKIKQIGYKHELDILNLNLRFKTGRESEQKISEIKQKIEVLEKNPPLPPPGYPVLFRAVQVKSIGIWDRKFNPKSNLWAIVNFQNREVSFPLCKEYEGQDCSLAFQNNEAGKCRNSNDELEPIICCEQKEYFQADEPRSNITAQWKLKKDCRK